MDRLQLTNVLTDLIIRIVFLVVWVFSFWGLDYLMDKLNASRHWSIAAGSLLGALLGAFLLWVLRITPEYKVTK